MEDPSAYLGARDFDADEKQAIQQCLQLNVGPEYVSYRQGPGGSGAPIRAACPLC